MIGAAWLAVALPREAGGQQDPPQIEATSDAVIIKARGGALLDGLTGEGPSPLVTEAALAQTVLGMESGIANRQEAAVRCATPALFPCLLRQRLYFSLITADI